MRASLLPTLLVLTACSGHPVLPLGRRLSDGRPITLALSSDGKEVVAELDHEDEDRSELLVFRAPFQSAPQGSGPEELGRHGATEASLSADGRWAGWLSSKERTDRWGSAHVRALGAGGKDIPLGSSQPPFVFGSEAVVSLVNYHGEYGVGVLQAVRLAGGARKNVLVDVGPDGFLALPDGSFVAAVRPGNGGPCRAVHLDRAGTNSTAIAADLACASQRPPFQPAGDGVLLRHADGALSWWSPARERQLSTAAEADAIDAQGRIWWVEREGKRIRVRRDGGAGQPALEIGSAEASFSRAIFPAGEHGAWVLLADRDCVSSAPALMASCQRLVAVGDAAPPPDSGAVRRVVASPAGGFPLALFTAEDGPPLLVAALDPRHIIPVCANAVAAAVSPDGREMAAVSWLDNGQRVLVADLSSGSVRQLSTGASEARLFWAGHALIYTWESFVGWEFQDQRTGLYAFDPDVP